MNRELDTKIAEEIYGWKPVKIGKDYNGENECEILTPTGKLENDMAEYLPRVGKIHRGYLTPTYSSSLSLAIELCKKVKLKVDVCNLPDNPEHIAGMCYSFFLNQSTNP